MSEIFLKCASRDGKPMAASLPLAVEEAALVATGERLCAKFTRQGELAGHPGPVRLLTITKTTWTGAGVVRGAKRIGICGFCGAHVTRYYSNKVPTTTFLAVEIRIGTKIGMCV